MRKIIEQMSLLFSNPSLAVKVEPEIWPSILSSIVFWVLSLLLFLQNSLSPEVYSVNIFQGPGIKDVPLKLAISILTQLIVVGLPFAILCKKGIMAYLSNLALIQFLCFGLALVGFLYSSVFWPLYKILPISGLTAKAGFDAVFLLYPALVLVVFRYVMLWMIATKAGASSRMIVLMCIIHLALSASVWLLGGVL